MRDLCKHISRLAYIGINLCVSHLSDLNIHIVTSDDKDRDCSQWSRVRDHAAVVVMSRVQLACLSSRSSLISTILQPAFTLLCLLSRSAFPLPCHPSADTQILRATYFCLSLPSLRVARTPTPSSNNDVASSWAPKCSPPPHNLPTT